MKNETNFQILEVHGFFINSNDKKVFLDGKDVKKFYRLFDEKYEIFSQFYDDDFSEQTTKDFCEKNIIARINDISVDDFELFFN